jgi:hypothetical protein
MAWFAWVALVLAGLVLAALALTTFGSMRWAARMQSLTASLEPVRVPPAMPAAHYDVGELEGLPAPVQRYFRVALTPGQAIVSTATIRMTGSFNLSATGERWRPFTSRQRVTTGRPGFLWDARISMLPGLTMRVVDSFIGGNGRLRAAIQGLFTVADTQGGGEIARGEFMRYFAEAAWYPTALLPSQGVQWQAVDERSASATLVEAPFSVTLRFRFDDLGLIESFHAEARGSMVGEVMVQAPWEGRFSNYRSCDGMRVPFTGEVAWIRPEGRKSYFEGSVSQLSHEFSS